MLALAYNKHVVHAGRPADAGGPDVWAGTASYRPRRCS